jgi:hypothetical protein
MRYVDVEPDLPDREPPSSTAIDGVCEMCGAATVMVWGLVELPNGRGGYRYATGWHCVESSACRKRQRDCDAAAAGRVRAAE